MALDKTRRYSRHTYGDDGADGKRNILSVSFVATDLKAPAAADNDAVHAAITGSATAAVDTEMDVTLDVPRNVTITAGGTATSITASAVTVTGTNVEGATITEDITPTADTAGTTAGNKAFKTVTKVSVPKQDAAGSTYSVGTGSKLGIGMRNISSMPIKVLAGDSLEDASASTFDASKVEANTVTTTTNLDGSTRFRVYVLNYNWAVDPTNGNPDYGV